MDHNVTLYLCPKYVYDTVNLCNHGIYRIPVLRILKKIKQHLMFLFLPLGQLSQRGIVSTILSVRLSVHGSCPD